MSNIALVSSAKNAYSETFIQAHKKYLKGNIKYYFDGGIPKQLEGKGKLKTNLKDKVLGKLQKRDNLFYLNKALESSFKKEKIDLIFVEYGNNANKILPICKSLNIPMIIHFHGYDIHIKNIVEDNNRYKELFSYASYIIGVSKSMCNKLQEIGCPKDKIIYTPCAPNDIFQNIESDFSKLHFLSIGRFVNKKSPLTTIMAFEEALKKHPNAELFFIGDGDLLETCFNYIKVKRLEQNIHLMGVKSPENILNLYKNAYAYIQHSITASNGDAEGTPVAVSEASMVGLPVIATRHEGIKDVILDGQTGLLSDELDIDSMAKNICTLIENKNLAIKMGQAGKKRMLSNFTMEHHINTLNNIIIKTLNKKNG